MLKYGNCIVDAFCKNLPALFILYLIVFNFSEANKWQLGRQAKQVLRVGQHFHCGSTRQKEAAAGFKLLLESEVVFPAASLCLRREGKRKT